MKIKNISLTMIVTLAMTACSNEDFTGNLTQSDEVMDAKNIISLNIVGNEEMMSRATDRDTYISWTDAYASTMSAFAWYNLLNCNVDGEGVISDRAIVSPAPRSTAAKIFATDNQRVEFGNSSNTAWASPASKWTYTPAKYWADYTSFNSFDFFAFMPYNASATVKCTAANQYTLSAPVTMSEGYAADLTAAPLICKVPIHKDITGDEIQLQMDQTLMGVKLDFKLGEKMNNVRDFKITSVKISGKVYTAGTVSRTYTFNEGAWTAGNISWSNTTSTNITEDAQKIVVPGDAGYLLVNQHADWQEWSTNPIYLIPNTSFIEGEEDFAPKIEVEYDCIVDIDGNGDGVKSETRKGVSSSIIYNATNFPNKYTGDGGMLGTITTIGIKIVPRFLYSLADDDMQLSVELKAAP